MANRPGLTVCYSPLVDAVLQGWRIGARAQAR